MRGAILYAPGDVRCEERADPMIMEPADAIVRALATCVCGSDLWRYRGIDQVTQATAIGHAWRCCHLDSAGPVRCGRLLCIRQHVPALPQRNALLLQSAHRFCRLPVRADPHPAC